MYNPINTFRRIKNRIGKPIRPIIEVQNDCTVVEITTGSVRDGNVIRGPMGEKTWALPVSAKTIAIYVDGIYKGMGHFATEEGVIVNLAKDVTLQREITSTGDDGTITTKIEPLGYVLTFTGIFSKLIDGAVIERGSALKQTWSVQMILIFVLGLGCAFLSGMTYAH